MVAVVWLTAGVASGWVTGVAGGWTAGVTWRIGYGRGGAGGRGRGGPVGRGCDGNGNALLRFNPFSVLVEQVRIGGGKVQADGGAGGGGGGGLQGGDGVAGFQTDMHDGVRA